jgi:ribonuclease BN (tRNA processing enzyme)
MSISGDIIARLATGADVLRNTSIFTLLAITATLSASPSAAQAPGASAASSESGRARLVLLGTGTPIADPARSGPALAIVVGDRSYLVDAGPGVVRRAAAAARRDSIPALAVANLRIVFLTHLHSDHTLGLPDLMLSPAVLHRQQPLVIYGPPGTRAMVDHLLAAYREDIDIRIHGLEHGDAAAYRMIVHEVAPGEIYRDSLVRVTAFAVKHGSWPHALGYRFDAAGRSIVVSGDTRPTDAIVDACHGCDVLVHEVYSKKGFDRLPEPNRRYHSTFHTSAIELGELASRSSPQLLVLTHILFFGESGDELLREVRSRFSGAVKLGEDLSVY